MNTADWVAVTMAPVTVLGAVVATLAWRTADKSWHTSEGARRDQAEAETRRRHRERQPALDVSIDMRWPPDVGLLVVKLTGPREVERYDWIRVEIRDDGKRREARPGTDVTDEAIRRQVWGPFRLRPGVDGADQTGRTAGQDGRAVTDEWWFTIERTIPPGWSTGGDADWRRQYDGKPVRLRVDIGLGEESWTEMVEVPQPKRGAFEDGGSLMA
ncbi:hypothetical protein AB0K04_23925 [Micromonospora coxensis]|uniref:hypothetical protein n=1 Tax=Micromonospora coxensis TaxID=356852 RepID=UPI003420C6FD